MTDKQKAVQDTGYQRGVEGSAGAWIKETERLPDHSRFLSKKSGAQYSKLCVADKLAIVITPSWLYLPMVRLTGEIKEYMKDAERNSNGQIKVQASQLVWYNGVREYVRKWVEEHKEIKPDTWTPAAREAINKDGVWR